MRTGNTLSLSETESGEKALAQLQLELVAESVVRRLSGGRCGVSRPVIPEAAFLVKVQALPTLIRAYGNKEGARRILAKRVPYIKSAFQKSSVAALFILAGDFESAMHLSKQLSSDPTKGHSLGRIASSLIQAGEFAAAKELLAHLVPKAMTKRRVAARGMVDGGQMDELKQWLPTMPSPDARVYACQGAINGLVQ